MTRISWLTVLLFLFTGCAADSPDVRPGQDVIFLVPGVGGDSPGYGELCRGLQEGGIHRAVVTVEWGAPKPLFMLNFSDPGIHRDAEEKLASAIIEARRTGPKARIDLIGHSAGGGVVAGALKRLPPGVQVQTVLLLAPSFSPSYDLAPAMRHVIGFTHLFHSDRDTVFLDWRTSHFGTYDGIETRAAGNTGVLSQPPRLIQHPYDPNWETLGHDGGHYGPIAEGFARVVLAPLLRDIPRPESTQPDSTRPDSTHPATRDDPG